MMSPERTAYRKIKDLSREEFILPGTSTCGGCGGLEALRLATKVIGEKVVYVNAAGCFTLLAIFPFTPFRGSWLYTTMGSAPAGAQGVRDAMDILIAKGELPREEDVQVIVLAGDGATYDIGMSSASGAIQRNLDFWYFCYDNEAYGNTGVQMSSATPFAAETHTSEPGALAPEGTEQKKKDIFEIWRAHGAPYIATVSPRHPVDLARKFEKAKKIKGPKMFVAFSPCPTGWKYDPSKTPEVAKLAVECGILALKEAVNGDVAHTHVPRKRIPVEAYLKTQGRFRHIFEPVRREDAINAIQEQVDKYWMAVNR
ncbi:MAG: pyruvate synthase [Nitrospirae bacterium RBG_16_64_22]|nr:MAG: pyruvate synthase [Nitrospirae bacterium RBG_16_64_22]